MTVPKMMDTIEMGLIKALPLDTKLTPPLRDVDDPSLIHISVYDNNDQKTDFLIQTSIESERQPIDNKDTVNRMLDIFAEALKDNAEVCDAFRYFGLVMNGKMKMPESEQEIQEALRKVYISPEKRIYDLHQKEE